MAKVSEPRHPTTPPPTPHDPNLTPTPTPTSLAGSLDPAYVSPRLRLGLRPRRLLPRVFRTALAQNETWFERLVSTPFRRACHEAAMAFRASVLIALFTPVIWLAPLAFGSLSATVLPSLRPAWCALLLWVIERAGPAFIKWGQWAAARPDLLPKDVCETLAQLQANAQSHSFKETARLVTESFGGSDVYYLFDEFEPMPLASGSIAQVGREGVNLRRRGGGGGERVHESLSLPLPLPRPLPHLPA